MGRGLKLIENPISVLAKKLNIPVYKVSSLLKDPSQLSNLPWEAVDYAVVVSFGYILPPEILGHLPNGFINLHPSLLPKYRGASPIETSIIKGDSMTGNTVMILDEGVDTGPILSQKKVPIGKTMTGFELRAVLAKEGAELLKETLKKYHKGAIRPRKQDDSKASYTKIYTKKDAYVSLKEPASLIYNKYRAFKNWMDIYTTLDDLEEFLDIKTKIKDRSLFIKLKELVLDEEGNLQILKLQLPNKNPITLKEFINGYAL